jgi:exosome complex exonuclease DIS3/RRP44
MLEPLLRVSAAVGLNLDVSSSKALADSLDLAVVYILFIFCIVF